MFPSVFSLPILKVGSCDGRRSAILVSYCLACIVGELECACAAERPNILFIISDDHGYQAVSAYGAGLNKTPNIDRIAAEGVRFDRCYVTNSLCGPSRACILTGKYSHKNGFFDNQQHVRRQPGDVSEVAAVGRLSDGDRRQVAPGERADGLRLLGNRCRGRGSTIGPISFRPRGGGVCPAM